MSISAALKGIYDRLAAVERAQQSAGWAIGSGTLSGQSTTTATPGIDWKYHYRIPFQSQKRVSINQYVQSITPTGAFPSLTMKLEIYKGYTWTAMGALEMSTQSTVNQNGIWWHTDFRADHLEGALMRLGYQLNNASSASFGEPTIRMF